MGVGARIRIVKAMYIVLIVKLKIKVMKTKIQEKYLCAGIDVSKDKLDVYYNSGEVEMHSCFSNDSDGHMKLYKLLGNKYHYVMESTGTYCLKLALFLTNKKCMVSVENALVIKRFIQMNLERNKSDKKDARWIFFYALRQRPKLWNAPTKLYMESLQTQNAIEMFTTQYGMIGNLLHSMEHSPVKDKNTVRILKAQQRQLKTKIEKLEKDLDKKLRTWVPDQLDNLLSIPGMGKRTASQLIIFTDGFSKISNYRQLISLAGLSPKEHTSGTSVRGRIRICKMGGSKVRKLLYMCSMTAIKKNKACTDLYNRLINKGKNGKLALIAV